VQLNARINGRGTKRLGVLILWGAGTPADHRPGSDLRVIRLESIPSDEIASHKPSSQDQSRRGSRISFRIADNQRTGGVSGNKGAFLGIGRTESLCLKRVNHVVENPFSKAFIKRSVTLQPSEEQGTTKHIDQQFWIGRRLQFS